jgi:acetyl esterase/lipase
MAGLLSAKDYPNQEGLPPAAIAYRQEALRLGAGVQGCDCRYGEDLYQRIALFIPPRPNGIVLGYMHGGGWTSGFKEILAFMAPAFLASIGYRLAPKHLLPISSTMRLAVAWLHAEVANYGADSARVFIGGHSAGGTMLPSSRSAATGRPASAFPSTC